MDSFSPPPKKVCVCVCVMGSVMGGGGGAVFGSAGTLKINVHLFLYVQTGT